MNVFQDLSINVPEEKWDQFIGQLELIKGRWFRTHAFDANESLIGGRLFCFELKNGGDIEARLWLCEKDKFNLYVTNILSATKKQLSMDEYNFYLNDFLREKLSSSPFRLALTKPVLNISDILSDECRKTFFAFSRTANRSTGSSHGSDRERWLKFIISVFQKREYLSESNLTGFLIDDGWDEETAADLATEYLFGIEVLKAYSES